MSGFKQSFKRITTAEEKDLLLSSLENEFPIAKPMWQVVRDTRDGLMEANIFTDNWPDYTTVVSQEFAPRLSQVADIRVHSERADKVMQVLEAAKLLEDIGNWQGIFFVTTSSVENEDQLSKNLVSALSQHPAVSGRGLSVSAYKMALYHDVYQMSHFLPHQPPSGYLIKNLLPEHAELVADEEKWSYRKKEDWYLHCTSFEQRLGYFREIIRRFGAVGAFATSNPSVPVAWILLKTGGFYGVAYTDHQHRDHSLFVHTTFKLGTMQVERKGVSLVEAKGEVLAENLERLGSSHGIVLQQQHAQQTRPKL